MQKPSNYDTVQAAEEFGSFENVKLGGHIVKIISAKEYTGISGNTSLQICVDIDGNDEQKGYFKKQYDANQNKEKRWANGATKYISLKEDDKCVAMFKGFITTVENSNPNFKWNFDESKLVGLKLVAVFGQEEYLNDKNEVKLSTKITQFRSLDKLKEVKIPKIKKLDNTFVDYEEYEANKTSISKKDQASLYSDFGDTVEIKDEDLAF